ncbi:putative ABC transport system permease protein [Lentzea fradiae]|uniref:Putative ABC transport system permease protein n=1 Tax=Lentzea fradiae TaxID=200378 RepID=A0A1G7SEZ3_9PSEU|nr:ABC transporter permease [Lentzea fradiae]SDG21626.1 putative ABC transport system permease protein [Lentzea fradiae]
MSDDLTRPVRLRPLDLLRLGAGGLRTRPLRAFLSALGIAVGIATMVVVVGIPASGRLALDRELSALGVNLLLAQAKFDERTQRLPPVPEEADAMVARIGPVTAAAAVANTSASIRRTDAVPPERGSGITVLAARPGLMPVIGAGVASGEFLTETSSALPVVVLGDKAATLLGITDVSRQRPVVWINDRWFTVTGVLAPAPLAPEVERAALVGWQAAKTWLGFTGHPTTVYVRAAESQVEQVRKVLAATVFAERPSSVVVSRPSDALAAKRITDTAFSGLFLGLAGVALLVGGVGVANTMVVSVLERRREIGLRRALGSTRGQVRGQFLTESALLCLGGGLAGVLLGTLGTVGYALSRGWPADIPPAALGLGVGGALLIGVLAGLYPAVRASLLTPTEALATP